MSPPEDLPGQLLADEAGRTQDQDLWLRRPGAAAATVARGGLELAASGAIAGLPPISTQVRTTSRPSSGERRDRLIPPGLA